MALIVLKISYDIVQDNHTENVITILSGGQIWDHQPGYKPRWNRDKTVKYDFH